MKDSSKTNQELITLGALVAAINQSLDLDVIINIALDKIMGVFQCRFTHIRLIDFNTDELVVTAHRGYSADDLTHLTIRRKYGEGLSAVPIKSGEVFTIEDLNTDPRYGAGDGFAQRIGVRSFIYFLLSAKGKILGDIVVHYDTPRTFRPEEIQLYIAIGHLIGTAIENARSYREKLEEIAERQRAEEAFRKSEKAASRLAQENDLVAEIGRIISSTLTIEDVYERFAEKVRDVIPFDRIAINKVNLKDYTRTIKYVDGNRFSGSHVGAVLSLTGTATEQIMRTKQGLIINSKSREEVAQKFPGVSSCQPGARSTMMIPLIAQDTVIGALALHSAKIDVYTENDLRLAERIGLQIAGSIANAQAFLERKQVEVKLRKSEEAYRSLASTVDSMYLVDKDCRYLFANEYYWESYVNKEELLIGRKYEDFNGKEGSRVFAAAVKYVFDTGDPYQDEWLTSRSKKYLRRTFSPIKDENGNVTAVTVTSKDISDRKQIEDLLKANLDQLESKVRERTIELEEINIALRVLFAKGEKDKKHLEETLQSNVNQLVLPFLSKLKVSQSDQERLAYSNILETNLNNITSPFINNVSITYKNLTPKELQIAALIKQGKGSKEIADFFSVSVGTIITHRNNIRKKLLLQTRGINLRSHLLSFG